MRLHAVLFRSDRELVEDGTEDNAAGTRCTTAADPGGGAQSDRNRNVPSDSVAIYQKIVTEPAPLLTPC